jgi:hypothetical protein
MSDRTSQATETATRGGELTAEPNGEMTAEPNGEMTDIVKSGWGDRPLAICCTRTFPRHDNQ